MTKPKADNLLENLEEYLRGESRLTGVSSGDQIIFKLQSKPKLRLEDATGRLFDLDEPEIGQFVSKISAIDSIKWVKIRNYEFETRFDFKNGHTKCIQIVLFSTDFDFIGESQTHHGKGPLIRVNVFPNPFKITELSDKIRGYLNRLGKRKFVSQAEMGINDINSLVEYIPRQVNPLSQTNEINKRKIEDLQFVKQFSKTNFLAQINPDGLKQLKKLQKQLKRRDLFEHLIRLNWKDPLLLNQAGNILIKPQYLKDEDASEGRSDD